MSYFKRPILLMFLGLPGSGKSYFARQAAESLQAIRLNGDSMRLAVFGSLENIEKVYKSKDRSTVNSYVFNGLDYAAEQILIRKYDVVYDAHHNKRTDRLALEKLTAKNNALPILVWIKTPYDVALKRGQDRKSQADQRQLSEEKMREVMDRHQAYMDLPDASENVIEIDGQQEFAKQFAVFCNGVNEIIEADAQ